MLKTPTGGTLVDHIDIYMYVYFIYIMTVRGGRPFLRVRLPTVPGEFKKELLNLGKGQ